MINKYIKLHKIESFNVLVHVLQTCELCQIKSNSAKASMGCVLITQYFLFFSLSTVSYENNIQAGYKGDLF